MEGLHDAGKRMLSERVWDQLRTAMMRGESQPGDALKSQELASGYEVSLEIARSVIPVLTRPGGAIVYTGSFAGRLARRSAQHTALRRGHCGC